MPKLLHVGLALVIVASPVSAAGIDESSVVEVLSGESASLGEIEALIARPPEGAAGMLRAEGATFRPGARLVSVARAVNDFSQSYIAKLREQAEFGALRASGKEPSEDQYASLIAEALERSTAGRWPGAGLSRSADSVSSSLDLGSAATRTLDDPGAMRSLDVGERDDRIARAGARALLDALRVAETRALTLATAEDSGKPTAHGEGSEAAGVASSVKDFLPIFQAFFGTEAISSSDNSLTAEVNFLRGPKTGPVTAKGFLSLTDPSLDPEVEKLLPGLTPPVTTDSLLDGLSAFDDTAVGFSFNLETKRLGRKLQSTDHVIAAMLSKESPGIIGRYRRALKDLGLGKIDENSDDVTVIVALLSLSDDDVERLSAENPDDAPTLNRLNAVGPSLGKLVANQPQVHFTIKRRTRDDLIGSDDLTIEAKWEMGFSNMNGLVRSVAGDDDRRTRKELSKDIRLVDLEKFVTEHEAGIKAGHRIKMRLAYVATSDVEPKIGGVALLRRERDHSLKASFGWGRAFHSATKEIGRLDLDTEYVDESSHVARNDRFIARLTWTLKSGELSWPITLSYSSRPEFLGETDEEFSAHFGLSYRLRDQQLQKATKGKS